ncbi:GNAT family N-acetyltransferase [Pelagibius sp. CAU 1746]|uniref:GNAT family N-acetyltransferase n=1 Tax=Pelagibius sp. CAU 1746 TaxID=3140370 RepID=UPI00325B475B
MSKAGLSAAQAEGGGGYRCMPRAEIADGRYAVRAVEPAHIEAIRRWRNAQIDVLRQAAPISPQQQADYYAREIWPTKQAAEPRNILLIYLEDGEPIGYGGLVHIAWEHRRAEISFLLDPAVPRSDAELGALFAQFLKLMKELAFRDLGFIRLHTETYAIRHVHIATLEACGFRREGCLRHHVIIGGRPTDALLHGCLAGDDAAE